MAENLKVGLYANGDSIPNLTDKTEWASDSAGAYCFNGNNTALKKIYGNLYNWHAVNDDRGLCPESWHVASDKEWIQLELFLGMSLSEANLMTAWRGTDEGTKLKATSFNGTDIVGFAALGTGYRDPEGKYLAMGSDNDYWTSSDHDNDGSMEGILHGLKDDKANVVRNFHDNNYGFCVRCIRDAAVHTEELNREPNTAMFPNPATNHVYIVEAEGKELTIHNLMGQTLSRKAITESRQQVDIAYLYPGTYLLRVAGEEAVTTFKFTKE